MRKDEGRIIFRKVRDFLFAAVNKEFLIFLFFNRYLVEGISTSGIKG